MALICELRNRFASSELDKVFGLCFPLVISERGHSWLPVYNQANHPNEAWCRVVRANIPSKTNSGDAGLAHDLLAFHPTRSQGYWFPSWEHIMKGNVNAISPSRLPESAYALRLHYGAIYLNCQVTWEPGSGNKPGHYKVCNPGDRREVYRGPDFILTGPDGEPPCLGTTSGERYTLVDITGSLGRADCFESLFVICQEITPWKVPEIPPYSPNWRSGVSYEYRLRKLIALRSK